MKNYISVRFSRRFKLRLSIAKILLKIISYVLGCKAEFCAASVIENNIRNTMKDIKLFLEEKWTDLSRKEKARRIGINHITLKRFEEGQMPSMENLFKLFKWWESNEKN